jgi:hypothetical protein
MQSQPTQNTHFDNRRQGGILPNGGLKFDNFE